MSEDHDLASEDDLLLPGASPGSSEDPGAAPRGMDEDGEPDMMDDDEGFFDHDIEHDSDEDMDDEDDGDLDVGSMPVHDLHLADAAAAATRAAEAAAAAAASAPAAPAAAAAAVAAAAGGGAGSSRAPWGGRSAAPGSGAGGAPTTAAAIAAANAGPKLVFMMNDRPLPAAATVFQAIQQSAMANGEGYEDGGDDGAAGVGGSGRRGQQLWDQVYTMHFRLAQPEDAAAAADAAAALAGPFGQAGAGAAGGSKAGDGDDRSHWRNSPLGELLSVSLPADLAAPRSCLDILQLLQLLEVLNRLAPRLLASQELQLLASAAAKQQQAGADADAMACSQEAVALAVGQSLGGQMALVHVRRDEFVSTKLGNKLAQQLKDVLSICGGSIPAWCHQLVVSGRFLFPFEVRRRYFYSTAFGLGRALHHMNQQQAAEGSGGALERDGRELRIGRLQRPKVRVSRRRILDSAVKVMEMYAKSRAVLELEYFGEVGTGLGPTLEFYTMLSHELQRRALGMWRHEEPPAADEQPAAKADQQQQRAAAAAAQDGGAAGQQQQQQGQAAAAAPLPVALHEEVVSHEQAAGSQADYVYAPYGLFPAPLPPAQRAPGAAAVEHFRLLGRCVAKALQDNRLLDLPLHPVFFRAALGKPLDLFDVAEIDPGLGASLERLARAAAAAAANSGDSGGGGLVMVDGCAVEDLCLTFTLPGGCGGSWA
jgi:E3 ubiquitin-protein ligase TRIP12